MPNWVADYPGAIVVEAANYGYVVPNRPKTWCFHTPEEKADEDPQTPGYIAGTPRQASYTYFVSYLGFVFQLVPELEGAYANCLSGKPAPHWSDGTNLNLQTLSLSFEGYAATIHQTMPRGCPQWVAGVNLVAHRTKALGLNLDWSIQHKDVSNQRGDCGQFDQAAFIADVKARRQEGREVALIRAPNNVLWYTDGTFKNRVAPGTGGEAVKLFGEPVKVSQKTVDDFWVRGDFIAQILKGVRKELDKTKLGS